MTCSTCGRSGPAALFTGAPTRRAPRGKVTRYCRPCREAYASRLAEGPRARGTNPRARGTNPIARGTSPRQLATNPRALGTNPVPGKAEAAGQWRAAWRRLGQLAPDQLHQLRASTLWALRQRGADVAELGRLLDRLDELLPS